MTTTTQNPYQAQILQQAQRKGLKLYEATCNDDDLIELLISTEVKNEN